MTHGNARSRFASANSARVYNLAVAAEPSREELPARTRALLPVWLWIALAVVLVFSTVTSYQARRTTRRLAELESQLAVERERTVALQAERKRSLLLTAIVSSSATRQYALYPSNPDDPALRAYWNEELGFVLSVPGAPPPKPGRTYQFWIVPAEGRAISVGVFSSDAAGGELHVFPFTARFSQAAALIVTDELEGGNLQPSGPPRWHADLKRPPITEEPSVEPPGVW